MRLSMQDTINKILYLNELHWHENAYQWLFYAGILLTLIFEKRKLVQIVFGWLPLLFLATIFNPICWKLMSLAGLHNDAYIVRLFSFMPLMYVIARGLIFSVQFLHRIRNEWVKLACVTIVCGSICLTGHNIYQESWLIEAENLAKVPQETQEILKKLESEKPVCIAAIDSSAVYIRQIADVITPYGRNVGELGQLLSCDPPDVPRVLELAGLQDVDFLVARRTQATLAAFDERGYEPYALTDAYAIYKVGEIERIRRGLNEKRQVTSLTYYDALGIARSINGGYCSEIYSYDTNGRWNRKSFIDQDGTPFVTDAGYSSVEQEYYINGDVKSRVYLDPFDEPVLVKGCYETRYSYNKDGRVVRESYYDRGKPMMNTHSLMAVKETEYYPSGNLKCERYLDENAKPVLSAWGYAGRDRAYDDQGHIVSEEYYDTEGKKIGSVRIDEPGPSSYMNWLYGCSDNAGKTGDSVVFSTTVEENRFNAVAFQLFDLNTGSYLLTFGYTYLIGLNAGEYHHELPDGMYILSFKGNTNKKDESINCLINLSKGDSLYYSFELDELQDKQVTVNNLYIGRIDPEALRYSHGA